MMVKICGITNDEDARAAAAAGASAIGLNFCRRSPRFITPEAATGIGRGLNVLRVGVFVDESIEAVAAAVRVAGLDIIQLHGSESAADLPRGLRIWKAFRVANGWSPEAASTYEVEAVLLDGPEPGTGAAFDWSRARGLRHKIILGGGLNEGNVREAIREVRPWGVDACSGLERAPGIKDHERMLRFVQAARAEGL